MIVGLLVVGEPPEELAPAHGRYPEMFRALLAEADEKLEIKVFEVQRGQLPLSTGECDAYLITGGAASVYQEEPWIRGLEAFIRACAKDGRRLVGVCFGHQVIAQALGGAVERSRKGWGLGRRTFSVNADKPWMRPPLLECSLYFSHQDQVTVPPPGAEVLAGDAHCPIQMYSIRDRIFCVQGHPEFTRPFAEAHLKLRRERLGPQRYAEAMAAMRDPVDRGTVARWITGFLKGA